LYSTLVGANVNQGSGVAVDTAGNVYGIGGGSNVLLTSNAFQSAPKDSADATIYKLASSSSTMTLASSSNPVAAQSPFTLTVNLGNASLVGSVSFFDGNSLLGTGSLSGGTASLSVALPPGIHRLSAAYRTNSVTADTAILYQIVNPALVCQ
jgi:hypothetical protein